MNEKPPQKPLGRKAYGHIAHLPGSRLGPGDHHVHEGQARIATERVRDRHDHVVVQEKLDGSCVAVANVDGEICPLGRAGYRAWTSPYEQHRIFAEWVATNEDRFRGLLAPGERVVGEWLAQAHGTRYDLKHEPLVVFDIMCAGTRLTVDEMTARIDGRFVMPKQLWAEGGSVSIATILGLIEVSGHGAIDPVEGAVWRVERKGAVDFLCKYVRSDKVDGHYLPELSGKDPVWNWHPRLATAADG